MFVSPQPWLQSKLSLSGRLGNLNQWKIVDPSGIYNEESGGIVGIPQESSNSQDRDNKLAPSSYQSLFASPLPDLSADSSSLCLIVQRECPSAAAAPFTP